MNDKTADLLRGLADKLGVATNHVYEVLTRQALITGYRDLILGFILLGITITCTMLTIKFIKTASNKNILDEDPWIFGGVVFTVIGVIAAIFTMVCFYTAIGELMNPEYYGIQNILDAIGGSKD